MEEKDQQRKERSKKQLRGTRRMGGWQRNQRSSDSQSGDGRSLKKQTQTS